MESERTIYEQAKLTLENALRVLICVNNRSSYDTHFAVVALKRLLEVEGKGVVVMTNGELILKHRRMFAREGVECVTELQNASYVITIDHAEGDIEKVSYDDKDGKFHLYITPVEAAEEFDFKKVSYSQGGGNFDTIVVFGCRSLGWLGDIYEQNRDLFTSVPILSINNLSGEQEFGTVRIIDTKLPVCELVLNVIGKSSKLITDSVAELLLKGMADHIQPFQTNGYELSSVEHMTELVRKGADFKKVVKYLYFDHTYEHFEVIRKVMSNVKYDEATGVAWSSVSSLDLTQCGVDRETFVLDGRIVFNTCSDFQVAFVIYEVQQGEIVVELESNRKEIDAKLLMSDFKVAGNSARIFFTIRDKTLADVEESVIKAISRRISTSQAPKVVGKPMAESEKSESTVRISEKSGVKVDAEDSLSAGEDALPDKLSSVSKGLVMPPPISTDEG